MRFNEGILQTVNADISYYNKQYSHKLKLFKSDTDNNYYDLMFDNDWIFFGDIFQINAAVKALCHTTSAIQLLAVKKVLQ